MRLFRQLVDFETWQNLICNQSISINLSIVIGNRYQSITTRIFAIDWSSIININRLIDIDWYWLISIVIDYRFHRLDTPGLIATLLNTLNKKTHELTGKNFNIKVYLAKCMLRCFCQSRKLQYMATLSSGFNWSTSELACIMSLLAGESIDNFCNLSAVGR